jgi:type VI secretion system secreted protein VgrG
MESSNMGFFQKTRLIQVFSPLGPDVLLFHRMHGQERLGGLFVYELDLLSTNAAISADQLLGDRLDVALTLPNGSVRHFNGIVCRFAQVGAIHDPDRPLIRYQVTLRPWLWLLTRTSNCRIFQKKDVPAIILKVFRDHGFTDVEARLTRTYPQRDYCVQYRESDFNFVSRLMEEEGIYYFFEHARGKHTLILADAATAHGKVPGYETVPFFEPGNVTRRERDHLFGWSFANEIQPGSCVLTDYDFTKPRADLKVKRQQPKSHAHAHWEVFDYPGRYVQPEHGEHYARTRLEAFHARHEMVRAEGNARGLTCGALFDLKGYPRPDQNREYLIVSADYWLETNAYLSGAVAPEEEFHCTLTALDNRQPYRPPCETQKPVVQGPQTAVVVGPKGEEIHTDPYGRVKVQFHWDREGQRDENSSCWVRVSQPWAGQGWGTVAIPRIGQEVIVDFLEGDPDQPIITGRVYNAQQRLPYKLPAAAHMMGFKSNSTPGGNGYCEMVIHDKAGEEKIVIHSQKDMSTTVQNNQSTLVNGPFQTTVVRNGFKETSVKKHVRLESLTEHIEITAATRITLTCGASQITLDKDGNITILGKQIISVATTDNVLMGQPIHLNPASAIPARIAPANSEVPLVGASGERGSRSPSSASITAPTKPPTVSVPAVETGLGSEVDKLVAKSPSLQKDWLKLKEEGWKTSYGGAGKGSFVDRKRRLITIDGSENGKPRETVLSLSHEVGHARYSYTRDYSSKEAFVNGALADEGAATLNNIKVRREILANGGPDIGIAGNPANHAAYNAAYDQALKDGDLSNARHSIGQIFGKGERTSNTGQSYADYYGAWYDKAFPPEKPK